MTAHNRQTTIYFQTLKEYLLILSDCVTLYVIIISIFIHRYTNRYTPKCLILGNKFSVVHVHFGLFTHSESVIVPLGCTDASLSIGKINTEANTLLWENSPVLLKLTQKHV